MHTVVFTFSPTHNWLDITEASCPAPSCTRFFPILDFYLVKTALVVSTRFELILGGLTYLTRDRIETVNELSSRFKSRIIWAS